MNSEKYAEGAKDVLQDRLDDDEWTIPQLANREPVNEFETLPVVKAGDGGTWVPVYVFVPKDLMDSITLENDPVYGAAVKEAARINKVGGIRHDEPPADCNIMATALAKMAIELSKLRRMDER